MRLVLKLFLGFFLIVGIAAFFVMRVFVNEVKPGVRQAMESTLVDAANVLAEMAAADVKAGTIRNVFYVDAATSSLRAPAHSNASSQVSTRIHLAEVASASPTKNDAPLSLSTPSR